MDTKFVGRWDMTVGEGEQQHPAWLEISESGCRYVGIWGSARPVSNLTAEDGVLRFQLPVQYEGYAGDLEFEGLWKDGRLVGTARLWQEGVAWYAVQAPAFERSIEPTAGTPIDLLEGGLSRWTARTAGMDNHWVPEQGGLINRATGSDIVSVSKFEDFELVAEYSYPSGSNSGIYLRGRYEFQILDDYGKEPGLGSSGAIYGFLKPRVNAIRPAGERNVAEIRLVGRTITVVLNGELIHDRQEIPGITGGALDSREGEPGPLLLQGDHGPVTFHRLVLTPLV